MFINLIQYYSSRPETKVLHSCTHDENIRNKFDYNWIPIVISVIGYCKFQIILISWLVIGHASLDLYSQESIEND